MRQIEERLRAAGIGSPRFEARQLSQFSKEQNLSETEQDALISRRIAGEPLQYILGEWEFYSLPFYVGKGVLIPRPDTETLVDVAIEFIGKERLDVIDLCSGSGCVAVAVDKNCENACVTALEKSPEAYRFLEKNIRLNNSRVRAVLGDVFGEPQGEYDVILSNPPYIPSADCECLQKEVLCEPKMALDGGADGLIFYREIVSRWLPCLRRGGLLAVEIGIGQAEDVKALFSKAGLKNVSSRRDLCGIERVIFGTLDSL